MSDFVLSGLGHQSAKAQRLANRLRKGNTVELIPDPDNEYDSTAVKVLVKGHQIGWVNKNSDRKDLIFKRIMKKGGGTGTVVWNEMEKGESGYLFRSIGIDANV